MPITRRHFLASLSVTLSSPALLTAADRGPALPLAFSTLGCPRWDWKTVVTRAAEWGYSAIELRGLHGQIDLTQSPEFAPARVAETLGELEARQLRISDLGSSARMHEADPRIRTAQLDEGKRYIDLAHRLKVPYVRVFGDRIAPAGAKQAAVDRVAAGLRDLGEHAQGSGVGVLIESHGDFCDSPTLHEILSGVGLPNVALLWDAHHTVVAGKESPAATWQKVGRYVRHVHVKDSKPEGKDVRYVLTGQGTIPLREIAQLLMEQRYGGCLSFEWEKMWHPEIEEPEVAFPQFAEYMRKVMG